MKFLYKFYKIVRFLRDQDVKWSNKLLFLLPVIYLISPIDLVYDFFPLAGQLDDIAVFVVMWPILKNLLSAYESGNFEKSSFRKKKYKDAIDMDKDDYEVK